MIRWLLSKMLRRKYFKSVDWSNGDDFSCEIYGFIDKDNVVHVTNVRYL